MENTTIDFTVENHGTVFLLVPHTPEATAWATDYLPDDATWFGGGIAVEHRYIGEIVAGIRNDGLEVR